jgi:LmbE family N-acetylglucosaminyl deacetylase
LTLRLATVLAAFQPELVFTHAYEGGHPDHDACAVAVQQAVALMESAPRPMIVEAPLYRLGAGGNMESGSFTQAAGPVAEVVLWLTPHEQARKRQMLDCFATQRATLAAFGVACERFRVSPGYDFSQRPNAGAVLYDRFGWGITSGHFVELARAACEQVAACR